MPAWKCLLGNDEQEAFGTVASGYSWLDFHRELKKNDHLLVG